MPPFVEEPFKNLRLPETLDRLKAASRLLGEMEASKEPWLNRGYLRSGLSEFRSVAQALHWDLGRRLVHSPEKSKNPLVHLVFRLRRVAVYLANAPTMEREVTATLEFEGRHTSAEVKIILIENIERYVRHEELTGYTEGDITRVCNWFEKNQREYGAPQVLDIGVLVYAQELIEVYANRAHD